MDHMCTARAVFQYTNDVESYFAVECLTPLSRVWTLEYFQVRGEEAIVDQALDQFTQTHLFGVIGMALVRDSLKDRGVDSLLEA